MIKVTQATPKSARASDLGLIIVFALLGIALTLTLAKWGFDAVGLS